MKVFIKPDSALTLRSRGTAEKRGSPLTPRWAYKPTAGLKYFSVERCQVLNAARC